MGENQLRAIPRAEITPQPLLSIVIPTYNRNKLLADNLKLLLPQINRFDVEIIVLDNSSQIPVRDYMESVFGAAIHEKVAVIRNITNIGLVGNSLRVFEIGRGLYIWTLCDDDLATPEAIDYIVDSLHRYPECEYLWFPVNGGPSHRKPGLYYGLLPAIKAEPNLFFIALSSCVFKRDYFLKRLRFGYLYAYSWAPFICPLLVEIDNAKNKIFIADKFVAAVCNEAIESKWSKLDVCLGVRTLLELPMSNEAYGYLKKSIDSFTFSTARLLLDTIVLNDRSRWHLFRIFLGRRYDQCSVSAASWTLLLLICQKAPRLTVYIIRIIERIVKRPLLIEVEDRFDRS